MYSKKEEEKKDMDAITEYVREWCLESSKKGFERYMKELDEKIAKEVRKETKTSNSLDIAKNLLNKKMKIQDIMDVTGLTRKQVLSLK